MEAETKMDKKKLEPNCMSSLPVISCNAGNKILFPKFSANKMDNIFAFTLNVRNVDSTSIVLQKCIDSIDCEFTNMGSGSFTCFYKFFVRFPNTNINEVQYEEWDNNLILHVNLDHRLVNRYFAGVDKNNLIEYCILENITNAANKLLKEFEDDSLSVAVSKKSSKPERKTSNLSIEIKIKETTNSDEVASDKPTNEHGINAEITSIQSTNYGSLVRKQDKQFTTNEGKQSKTSHRRKNKNRTLSDSISDRLMVEHTSSKMEVKPFLQTTLESSELPIKPEMISKQRKYRSVSESCTLTSNGETESSSAEYLSTLIQFNQKYKGILKRCSYRRSISECSSIDDYYYIGSSMDVCGDSCLAVKSSVELSNSALLECCRKTVRFNDSIKTIVFRSNTSILAQKRRNAKKNESKRRVLSRRLSEGESADNEDKDAVKTNPLASQGLQGNMEHDSGISLESDSGPTIEKTLETEVQNPCLKDSSKPIEINRKGAKKGVNKTHSSRKYQSLSQDSNVGKNSFNNIGFKNDMIFEIEV